MEGLSGLAALVDYSMGLTDFPMAIYKSSSYLLHFNYVCQSISIIILLIIRYQNKNQQPAFFQIPHHQHDQQRGYQPVARAQ